MKSKVMKSGSKAFVKGGSGKMVGKQFASPDVAGMTGKVANGTGGKFAKGGSTKMFGQQTAAPARAK
jgi:hypothetical protein